MFVTLSSKNETNHANFTNFFQDIIKIKPNSYICLVNTSLITADNGTLITIGPNQRLHIVYNIYNIIRLPLTEGEYTVSRWCDLMNADLNTTTSHCIWAVRFEDTLAGTITLEFYRKNTIPAGVVIPWFADTGFEPNFHETVFAATYPYSYWRAVAGVNTLPLSRPTGIGTDDPKNIAGVFNNGGAAYDMVSHWGLGNVEIYNTYNYISQNRYDNNIYSFCWNDFGGVYYFQTAPHMVANIYLQGNIYRLDGSNSYDLRPQERKFYWEFKANKKVDTHIIYQDGSDNVVSTDLEYLPGDVFLCRQVGRDWNDGNPGGNNLSLSAVKYSTNTGLQLWIPFDIPTNATNNISYNSQQGNCVYADGVSIRDGVNSIGTITKYGFDALSYYQALNLGMTKTGFRAGGGEDLGNNALPQNGNLGQYIYDEYISDAGTPAVGQDAAFSQMPNTNALFLDRSNHERYSLFTRNAAQLVSANEAINTDLPSLIVISFYCVPDGTTGFTLLGHGGGGSQQTVEIDTAGAGTQIQIWDSAGAVLNTKFPTINIAANTKYTLGIATFGDYIDTGTPRWKLYLQEQDGTQHTHHVTPATKDMASIQCIGGKLPAPTGDDSQYFNGNLWDFRFYQRSEYGVGHIPDTTYWDDVFTGVADYTINTANAAALKPDSWYGVYERHIVFEPDKNVDNEWYMLPRSTGSQFPNWYVDYNGGAGVADWFDFLNMNYTQPMGVHHNRFDSLTGTLDVDSIPILPLASSGVSIMNANQLECRDARDVLQMFSGTNIGDDYAWVPMNDADFTEFGDVAEIQGGHVVNTTTDVVRNINIENLPQQSLDGNRKQISKTIYQLPSVMEERTVNERVHRSLTVPEKVKIPLNNPGDMYINQLEVKITNEEGQEDPTLVSTSNVVVEIKEYD